VGASAWNQALSGWLEVGHDGTPKAGGLRVNPAPRDVDTLAVLARAAGAGDARAFRAWVEAVTPTVYRLAFRMLRSGADAEDVVQETMVRAWQNLGGMQDPQASLAWVCRVARNVATDRARSRGRGAMGHSVPLEGDDARDWAHRLTDPGADPEQLAHDAGARAFLRSVMDALPENHRLVLMMVDVDGASAPEVAAALDIPVGTVDSRLHRAREALGKKIRGLKARRGWRFW
jgi:RNA polymerase sigma-70 factor (ECF subfamily)